MNILLHTTETSTLVYDPSVPCIMDTINGFLLSDEIRLHLDKGLELAIEKKKITGKIGWLANTQQAGAFLEEDLRWLTHDWMQRAANAGILYMANILPDHEIFQFASDFVREEIHNATTANLVELRYFTDVETAKDWLQKVVNQ